MAERILVTGVTGFIGSHLVRELARKRYDVYGVMRYATNRNPVLKKEFLAGATLINCDITDYLSVRNAIKSSDPDTIVHLAALSPVRESFERPFPYVNTNIVGTFNFTYAMMELYSGLSSQEFQRKRLIFASTAEVYGLKKNSPTKEDASLEPTSPYANTKAMGDMHMRMMARVHGLNTTVMRCTNSYGRKIDASFFVEYVITSMLNGENVYVGAPKSLRDYMYVSDHVSAYVSAIEKKSLTPGEAFNAATGKLISNKDLAYKLADMIGFSKKKVILGKYPPGYPKRPYESDQPFINLDCAKIRKAMDWKAEVALDAGLKKTIAFWREKLGR